MISSNVRIKYKPNDPLNGAFAYLQKKFNTVDIQDEFVKINASSTVKDLYVPVTLKDFVTSKYWTSKNENGSWYEVDFLQNMFYLEKYFLRAATFDFFSKWQVLGSNDGIHFDVVDDVTDFEKPKIDSITFKCKYPKIRRVFRIVANGESNIGDFVFNLHRLEFYGSFVSNLIFKTCKNKNNNNRISFAFIISSYSIITSSIEELT